MARDCNQTGLLHRNGDDLTKLKLQFLASLNHEIRTPLSGIFGMTDLLVETELTLDQREYVAATRECATQLFDLLNTTLAYNSLLSGGIKLEAVEFRPSEMLESLAAEYQVRAAQKGLELKVEFSQQLPDAVRSYEYHVKQVCGLLLNNALKFTTKGRIYFSVEPAPDGLRFAVRDTGIGIPPERLPELFDPFYQGDSAVRSTSGLGLGLALARGLVELMGGSLNVESTLGRGSRFSFTLKFNVEQSAGDGEAPESAVSLKRILLVDDDRISQRIITAILRKSDIPCDTVADGLSALERVAGGDYSLILMDLRMPGIDGFETARRIRQLKDSRSVPVVALTANCDDDTRAQCWREGMAAFLTKPVQPSELMSTVQRFLRMSAGH